MVILCVSGRDAKIASNEGLIFIAGGGRFSSLAAKFFKGRGGVKALLADVRADCPAREHVNFVAADLDGLDFTKGVNLIVADAVGVLLELLSLGTVPERVVPAIPGHFAGKALKSYLERRGLAVTPSNSLLGEASYRLPKDLALSVDEANAVLVCGYMPFGRMCKVPCSQPIV